jgi:hypothetical protein
MSLSFEITALIQHKLLYNRCPIFLSLLPDQLDNHKRSLSTGTYHSGSMTDGEIQLEKALAVRDAFKWEICAEFICSCKS